MEPELNSKTLCLNFWLVNSHPLKWTYSHNGWCSPSGVWMQKMKTLFKDTFSDWMLWSWCLCGIHNVYPIWHSFGILSDIYMLESDFFLLLCLVDSPPWSTATCFSFSYTSTVKWKLLPKFVGPGHMELRSFVIKSLVQCCGIGDKLKRDEWSMFVCLIQRK